MAGCRFSFLSVCWFVHDVCVRVCVWHEQMRIGHIVYEEVRGQSPVSVFAFYSVWGRSLGAVYANLAGLPSSGDSPVSTFRLAVGVLGLQRHSRYLNLGPCIAQPTLQSLIHLPQADFLWFWGNLIPWVQPLIKQRKEWAWFQCVPHPWVHPPAFNLFLLWYFLMSYCASILPTLLYIIQFE